MSQEEKMITYRKCRQCFGYGTIFGEKCSLCNGTGIIEKLYID